MGNTYEKIVDNMLDLIFFKDKTKSTVFLIFLLGLILRIIAAINLGVSADDMVHSVHAINFLKSGKLVEYSQSASLWYYLTDISYNLLCYTQLSSRLIAIIFGSLSILVIFLLTKEYFGDKAGLFAALFLALSPFHVKNTLAEMDNFTIFLVLMSLYFTVKFMNADIRHKKLRYSIGAGIFLGLSILTKVYVFLFIPVIIGMVLYNNYSNNKKLLEKASTKYLLIILIISFIFFIPSITHNYLLYKDKGITDFMYANTFGIRNEKNTQLYGFDAGWGDKADFKGFFFGNSRHLGNNPIPSGLFALSFLAYTDPLVFILGLMGLAFSFKRNKKFLMLSLFIFVFVFIFMASRMLMSKHYIFLLIIFIPSAGMFFNQINELIKTKIKSHTTLNSIILITVFYLILLGYNSVYTHSPFYTKSAVGQFIDFKNEIGSDSALYVADSRIYRGRANWMLYGTNYVEASQLQSLMEQSEQLPGIKSPTDIYFIECVTDDCGWGTIKNQPEFNASMEDMVKFFSNNSKVVAEFFDYGKNRYYWPIFNDKGVLELRIYKTSGMINQNIYQILKATRSWFLYPIGYDETAIQIFDKYKTYNILDSGLDKLAHLIVYLGIFLALASIVFVFYLFIMEK